MKTLVKRSLYKFFIAAYACGLTAIIVTFAILSPAFSQTKSQGAKAAPTKLAHASEATCENLWYSRNRILSESGFCFKNTRALMTFGSASCFYSKLEDVPFTSAQKQMVQNIISQEKSKNCPDI